MLSRSALACLGAVFLSGCVADDLGPAAHDISEGMRVYSGLETGLQLRYEEAADGAVGFYYNPAIPHASGPNDHWGLDRCHFGRSVCLWDRANQADTLIVSDVDRDLLASELAKDGHTLTAHQVLANGCVRSTVVQAGDPQTTTTSTTYCRGVGVTEVSVQEGGFTRTYKLESRSGLGGPLR